jgi:hypothetical protein
MYELCSDVFHGGRQHGNIMRGSEVNEHTDGRERASLGKLAMMRRVCNIMLCTKQPTRHHDDRGRDAERS